MSITINKIELNNWHNYKGEYNKNVFDFTDGLNILVGTNNAGKTKLHNAFRLILEDKIILKMRERSKEVYRLEKINNQTIKEVFNKSTFRNMKQNGLETMGVRLSYSIERRGETHKYMLEKNFKIRKDVDKPVLVNSDQIVFKINPFTESKRKVSDKFEDRVKEIIRPQYLKFFLVEGEQMGLMTPLFGDELKRTINSITNLQSVDSLVERTIKIGRKSRKKKEAIQTSLNNLTDQEKDNAQKIVELEERNVEIIEEDIPKWKKLFEINDKLEKDYTEDHENAKRNKTLAKQLNEYREDEQRINTAIDTNYKQIMNDYLDHSILSIAKINDDTLLFDQLELKEKEVSEYYTSRRTELDSKLSSKEREMLFQLEKSQPKPEILENMVEAGQCFVCSSELHAKEKKYINEKLIPFFRGEQESNDPELKILDDVRDILRNLFLSAKNYMTDDVEYFTTKEELIADLVDDLIDSQNKINDFININGEIKVREEDKVTLETYNRAIIEKAEAEKKLKSLRDEKANNISQIAELRKKAIPDDKKTEPYRNAESLLNFIENLEEKLISLKQEKYLEFADKLGSSATERFQKLMRNNPVAKNQKLEVKVNPTGGNEFDFEINLVNWLGERQDQAGGATSSLKPLAVVFGLIDMAELFIGHPFIADAPVSNLTPDTKESFFDTLLEDKAFNQCIVMTMDLWDNKTNDINKLGKNILEMIRVKEDSNFMTVSPSEGNDGVTINRLN